MWIKRLLFAALLLLTMSLPALAEDAPMAPGRKRWQPAAAAVVLVLAVGTVSIMGSKRGHQD